MAIFAASGGLLLALDVPYLSGRVVDNANMLSAATVAAIESRLKTYEDSTSNQIAVLTIQSLEGESLEEYSLRVAETWKLGKKGVDNGALLLIVRNERKIRIETGYGLEASLTDAATSFIINSKIKPNFKSGDFDEGVRAGVDAIIQAADGKLDTSGSAPGISGDWFVLLFLIFWFGIVTLFTLNALFTEGGASWFLYVFLMPFYAAPSFILSTVGMTVVGIVILAVYVIGFPVFKLFVPGTGWGKKLAAKLKTKGAGGHGFWIGSGWSGGGGGFSSGGGFSGGGGSFGGGGSSGSW